MKRLIPLLSVAIGFIQSVRADSVVVFNEIMYHPALNEPAMEWVELHNLFAADVDVSGWEITGDINYTFASNTIIRGGAYLLLASSPATLSGITGLTNIVGPFTNRLGNNGGTLRLRNNSGRVMDEISYGTDGDWPVAPDGAGVSLAKHDPDSASGPAANWTSSEQMGGTPGTRNFAPPGFNGPSGLVSYWSFNEPLGTYVGDATRANFGTAGSGVARVTASSGRALSFNGTSNAFVNVGAGATFNVGDGITVEALLQPGWSGSGSAVIFRKAPRRPPAYRDAVLTNSPIAYWRLGDGTTTIADSGPSNRVGTATAGVLLNQPGLIASDPANGAARFTAAERITVNGFEKIGAAGYTVEYWVRPITLPASCCQNLVGDGEASGDYFMMNYILGPAQGTTGLIRPHFGPGNNPVSLNGVTALQANNTYHIVTTWDTSVAANNAAIYVNGVLDQTGTITRNVPAAGTTGANRVYIGKDDRDTTDGTEVIDEVALYNRPLSASDVAAHYLAGVTANFDVNQGYAIQLAFQNDGSNGLANPPVAAGPVLSFGITVGGTYSELDMPLDGQQGRPPLAALEDGRLHHIAATFDSASGLKAIYIDGVMRFSTTIGGGLNATNFGVAVLGNSETNGNAPFVGTLDEMAYWSRALSPAEVGAHWTSSQAGRDYFTPEPTGSAATLAFNEYSATTNADFWLELVNYGTNPVAVAGFVLRRDGAGSADNEYVFPSGLPIGAGGYLVISNSTLGFHPVDGDRLFLLPPARDKVLDSLVLTKGPRARSPAATGPFARPATSTPGGANSFAFHNEIVINEIMYNHARLPGTNNSLPSESPEAWIELFNRSGNAVNLTGWELDGGLHYLFTPGQTIPAGGYLVVADDAAYLRTLYPGITIVGDFEGRLSGSGDRIVLKDASGNTADEVSYLDRAPWPEYADGGGSSLELADARLDNSRPEAWAASDEGGKTSWTNVSYRMIAAIPAGNGQPTVWADFIFGLLGPGECLIDDISVIETPATTPLQLISNGGFDSGLSGWRVLGTHGQSYLDVDPLSPGNPVLHVVATGPQEHMHNHIERTLNNQRLPQNGVEYQISYRVKWLAGNNLLNTRLYFNRCARTTALPIPALNGTPGAPNGAHDNVGIPTFSGLAHEPAVPHPGEPVTVSVKAEHFAGAPTCKLYWSVDSGASNVTVMTADGKGGYTAAIPGQAAGAIVQFWILGEQGGADAWYPAEGPNSGALYQVTDGQALLSAGHNLRIVVTPANRDMLQDLDVTGLRSTNVMSNARIPGTVIYDERRAYYNVGVRLKGSQRGRANRDRISYHLEFPPDDLFRGVHPFMLIDRSGAGDATANKQQEILIKHILLRAGDIPGTQSDMCRVIAPRTAMTGSALLSPRYEDNFIETAFEDGGDGGMWELELIYYVNGGQTNQYGYKFVQQPPPNNDSVTGTDISDVGNDEETYRYNFMIKMHRDVDDYAPFIAFAKACSLAGTALDQETKKVMDVDEWMRVWALVTLCGVGDTYTFGNNHNLFMYRRPSDGKMLALPADMDFSFNRAANSGLVGDQNISDVINLPANLRLFYGHILDIINTSYNVSYMTYWVNHYQNLISPAQNYSAVLTYIQQRITTAVGTINGQAGTSFTVNGGTLITTNNNLLTFTGNAPAQVKTIRVNGVEYAVTWNTVSQWTLRVPVSAGSNVLNIVGYDLHGNALTNFSRTVTNIYTGPLPDPVGSIVFNELMVNPAAPGGPFVELLNSSGAAFDISGYQVNGLDYTFPKGSIIAAGQCLALAADPTAFSNYGTNAVLFDQFSGRLDPDGETLTLLKPGLDGAPDVVVDKIRYEGRAPWPVGAGTNSVQLIAAAQDNTRPGNWTDREEWRFVSYTGTISGGTSQGTNFLIFLFTAGELYVDDITLVTGTQAGVGPNLLANGDFESAFSGPWTPLGNHTNSVITTDVSHSGSASLRIIATGAGAASSAVRQIIAPFAANTVCTVSFWFRPATNNQQVVLRTTPGSSFTSVNSARLAPFTPGFANSVAAILPAFDPVWLNEVQADNLTGPLDNAGQREPWIELFNSGASSIDLSGYYLANNYNSNLTQWPFPPGSSIAPGEFKVIWADGQPGQTSGNNLHTSFRLNSATGSVALVRLVENKPQITDYLTYSSLQTDRSYGDYPDGQIPERRPFFRATPGAANNPAAAPIQVRINEWMAQNTTGLINTNNSNRRNDWFELYNPTDTPASLDGYFLSDSLTDKFRFPIPAGRVVPPHGYLFAWADAQPQLNTNATDTALHVNFSLDQDGDQIGLFAADGTPVDTVDFAHESQFANYSEGRFADGSTNIYILSQATPLAANVIWANRYPNLAEIPDALVLTGESLSFAAVVTDPDLPTQTFTFELDNNAPTGAVVNAVSGQFDWTPSAAQSPSTNSFTLSVTDSGTPPLTAARTFTVVVKPGIRITGVIRQQNGSIAFSVGTISGKTYRVEYKNDLSEQNWSVLIPNQVVNATTLPVSDIIGNNPQRFYRVVQVD